jgi:hypothetical protein
MAAILPIILQLLTLMPSLMKLAGDLKQSGELTPEQEKALDDALAAAKTAPAWQPDPTT